MIDIGFSEEKSVLITGNRGFLGRHLSKYLKNIGYKIYVSNTKIANLMNDENLHIYNNIKFDYIFHLAAHTKAGDYCLYHKGEQFEINQKINSNILKYWREFQPQAKMIAMGTSCSYSPELPMCENNYLLGEPDIGLYTYAMTKRMLLVGLKSYAEQFGLKYIYYVPSTLYGTQFDKEDSHFIFDLIKKIHKGKNFQSPVELWGDGYQKRELIYIDDAIKLILGTLHLDNEILNLGSGEELSIRDYAKIISDIIGYDEDNIFYDTSKYVGVKSKKIDTNKILNSYPNFIHTKLNDGLYETIKYYEKLIKND
jgi:GDP-L-fucose synthase